MSGKIVIFGYGTVGRVTAARLLAEENEVAISQRSPPPALSDRMTFIPCDALDRESVIKAARGAGQFVVAIGLPYSGAVWREAWPRAISNFVAAAEDAGARMIFVDNLYMYGPQTAPLVETTPLTDFGAKPAARAVATRVWMEAALTGRVRVAALRAPDFYGPGVGQSYLGDSTIGALARGKAATFIGSPEMLHDYAYVPDVARAVTTLLGAPDSAFGQAWHVPCAPTRTTRQILEIAAEALGVRPRIHELPVWLLKPAGLFSPFMRELVEMRFQWDRPYCVIASRFAKAFWSDATPFETGVKLTALAFRAGAEAKRRPEAPKSSAQPSKRRDEAPKDRSEPSKGGVEPFAGTAETAKVDKPQKKSANEPLNHGKKPPGANEPPQRADKPPKGADELPKRPPKRRGRPPLRPKADRAPAPSTDGPKDSERPTADDAPPEGGLAPTEVGDELHKGRDQTPKGGSAHPERAPEPLKGDELPKVGDEYHKDGREEGHGAGKKRSKDPLATRRLQGLDRMPRMRSSWWSSLLRR